MKRSQKERMSWLILTLRSYVIFFVLMCFIITCSMLLFLNQMTRVTGIELMEEHIRKAALLTFLNIILLSLLCTVIDAIRRHLLVERPVKRIVEGCQRLMAGDLSVRIHKTALLDPYNGFDTVIDYINEMAEELSKMETLRTDFIANVSHELKTPMTVIQNYATLLQQPNLSEDKRQAYASAMMDTSKRLTSMITNILKLNKLENQTIYPNTQTYDLGEQLCECLLGFEELWEDKHLDIQTDIAEGVQVRTDPELLFLVWNNLFSNAIKFTEPGGTVSLCLKTTPTLAVVEVKDTGCGIPAEVGEHIFEKFYQGDTSHITQGNGLGLALVRRVIDIMHGDISVTSEVGKGSLFIVRLERVQDGSI